MRSLASLLSILFLPVPLLAADDPATTRPVSIEPGPDDPKEKVKPGKIDKDAPTEFKKTKSGLRYRVLRKGSNERPTESDLVDIHYKGWLHDKNRTIFRSTYRKGTSREHPVKRVMPGWTEGLQLIGKGGMIELDLPAELAYGKRGIKGHVPPNARVHFIIELIDFRPEIKVF